MRPEVSGVMATRRLTIPTVEAKLQRTYRGEEVAAVPVHRLERAAAARHAGERVVGDIHAMQTGLLGDQLVEVAQQGAAAGQHDAAFGDVRAEFGRVCSSACDGARRCRPAARSASRS